MKKKDNTKLRKGFTTGSSAAAGAKAAVTLLLTGKLLNEVEVTLPRSGDGTIVIPVKMVTLDGGVATATIIKDAGDDPDVTDKAEIVTEVRLVSEAPGDGEDSIRVLGGRGVGKVTRPGLSVAPGNPAINPVPMKMIKEAVSEVTDTLCVPPSVLVTVNVPRGVELAKYTMNARLGIIGGISILGTTGIVHPLSLSAYTDSIGCAVEVAVATGLSEVVFSTGRSSERVAEEGLKLDGAAYILTGDHMGFALLEAAKKKEIKRVTVSGQFGKFSKLARGEFETHCKDSSVEMGFLKDVAVRNGATKELALRIEQANTAREVFFIFKEEALEGAIREITALVKKNAAERSAGGVSVMSMLVGYDGKVEVSL